MDQGCFFVEICFIDFTLLRNIVSNLVKDAKIELFNPKSDH